MTKRTHEEVRAILDGPDGDRVQHYWSLVANEPGLHKIIEQLLAEVEAFGEICDNHNIEVCGGGCWVCATIHSHPDREKLIGQLREQYLEMRNEVHGMARVLARTGRLAEAWKAVHLARIVMDDINSPAINPTEAYLSAETLYLKALESAHKLEGGDDGE